MQSVVGSSRLPIYECDVAPIRSHCGDITCHRFLSSLLAAQTIRSMAGRGLSHRRTASTTARRVAPMLAVQWSE
jgi:hypothetical protein